MPRRATRNAPEAIKVTPLNSRPAADWYGRTACLAWAVGKRGWTPAQWERWFGDTDCVQLLRPAERGA